MKNFAIFSIIFTSFLLQSCDNNITIAKSRGRNIASEHTEKLNGKENLSDGIANFLYYEQNFHLRAHSQINQKFPLPYYLIPATDAKFIYANSLNPKISNQLFILVSGTKYYKLFVHPESEGHYDFLKNAYRYISAEETEFMATPTSSSRSMVVWNPTRENSTPFIAKLSLDQKTNENKDRLISVNEVVRSIANQKIFDVLGQEKLEEINVKIFPETAGLVFDREQNGAPDSLGGQLIREIPEALSSGEKKWLSFTVLLSTNESLPLIMNLIKKSGLSSYDFFDQWMIKNYIQMFDDLSLKSGINFEPLPQNLAMETAPDLTPTGKWVVRDFENLASYPAGRANYISNYAYFYKKHIFDTSLAVVSKLDPTLTPDKVMELQSKLENAYLKVMTSYLKPMLAKKLDLVTYRKIETIIIDHTSTGIDSEKKLIHDSSELKAFFLRKKVNKEWIELAKNAQGKSTFFLTDHAVYEVADEKVISLALFNQKELEYYKTNNGRLDGFLQEYHYKANGSCSTMILNFFR